MLEDVSSQGAVFVGIISLLLCLFTSSTTLLAVWAVLASIYAKNRWWESWLGESHAANSGDEQAQHEVRRRSAKDNSKKYEWDTYDNSFNDHWRQRLMSFTVPPVNAVRGMNKRMVNAVPAPRTQHHLRHVMSPEQQKLKANTYSPINKSSAQPFGKHVAEPIKSEWTRPVYGLGVYPKVSLSGFQPRLLSDCRSHLKKNFVTVKLSPMHQPSHPPRVESNVSAEQQSVVSSLRKQSRKRHLKNKQTTSVNDKKKKQRVENSGNESLVEKSLLPDHFIEDANTVSEALKRLEKVHKVFGSPKTNAIESSFSSMKRYQTQSLKRSLSSDEESPIAKLIRQEPEPSPFSAFLSDDDAKSEKESIQVDEENSESEEEVAKSEEKTRRQIYVPSMKDHLDDRSNDHQRLQHILKQFSVVKNNSMTKSLTEDAEVNKANSSLEQASDKSESDVKVVEKEVSSATSSSATNCEKSSVEATQPQPPLTTTATTTTVSNLNFDKPATVNFQFATSTPSNSINLNNKSSPIQCNGSDKTPNVSSTAVTSDVNSPIKLAFQFGSPEQLKNSSGGGFTFGAANLHNGVSNGFDFTANITKTPPTFGSDVNSSMFTVGAGSTAPRKTKMAARNRFR